MEDKISEARRQACVQAAAKIILMASGQKENAARLAAKMSEAEVRALIKGMNESGDAMPRVIAQRAQEALDRMDRPPEEWVRKRRDSQIHSAARLGGIPMEKLAFSSIPSGIYCIGPDDKVRCLDTFHQRFTFGRSLDHSPLAKKPTLWQRIVEFFKREVFMEQNETRKQRNTWKWFLVRFQNEKAKELFEQNPNSEFIKPIWCDDLSILAEIRTDVLQQLKILNPSAKFKTAPPPLFHGISGQRDI